MKKFLFLIGLLFGATALAQKTGAKLDSIRNVALSKEDPLERSEGLLVYAQYLATTSTDSALAFMDSLIDEYQHQGATQLEARAMSLKSWFLNFQAKHKEAAELGHQALNMLLPLEDSLGIAQAYNRIGLAYIYFERYEDARTYLGKSLALFEIRKDTARLDMILNNLGVVCSELKDYRGALMYYRQSLELRKKIGNYHWIAYSHHNMGESFMGLDEMDSAKYHYLRSVYLWKHKTPAKEVPALGSVSVGAFYKEYGNADSARYWLSKALEDAQQINHIEVILLSEKLLSELYAEGQDWQKAYAHLEVYNRLKSEADSINNYEKVAEVEARFQNAEKEAEISRLQAEQLQVSNRNQQLLMVLSALMVAVLIVVLVYQRRLQKNHLEKSELNRMLSETRMLALRAQMNPHFIFNAINTGQHFILNSDQAAAYDYLSKFARLLRLVLENSDKTFVSLDDEVTQIQLYLELEAIRFEHAFDYSINVDESLKDGIIEMPGMFIQPIIENAIIHGLTNLESGRGALNIHFRRTKDILECVVADNGVGRERAAEIKARKQIPYTSKALANIEQRLGALQTEFGPEVGIQIIDLKSGGKATGTEVILNLPLR